MRFKLICPSTSEVWDTPANAGFDRAAIVARLDAMRAGGHDYELIDGDALSDQERSDLYGQAFSALARTGNHYRIRQVVGSRRHGGGDHLGSGVAALLVFNNGEPVAVYPHQAGNGYENDPHLPRRAVAAASATDDGERQDGPREAFAEAATA